MNGRLWVLGPASPQVDAVEYVLRVCGEEILYALDGFERTSWWDWSGWDGQRVRLVDVDCDWRSAIVNHYPYEPTSDFRLTPVAAVYRHLARTYRLEPALLTDVYPGSFSDLPGQLYETGGDVWRITFRPFGEPKGELLVGTIRPEVIAPALREINAWSQHYEQPTMDSW